MYTIKSLKAIKPNGNAGFLDTAWVTYPDCKNMDYREMVIQLENLQTLQSEKCFGVFDSEANEPLFVYIHGVRLSR